jgi:hypothetical protein
VDWQEVTAALLGSGEWCQLCSDLAALRGGPAVAALLRRAAAALCAASAASEGSAGPSHGACPRSAARLAEAVQQVAWEKLHTGDWHAVPLTWRDAYAAACVLAAAAGLPAPAADLAAAADAASSVAPARPLSDVAAASPAGAAEGAAGAEAARGAGQAAELGRAGAALWHLDMAAIMGGPLLRPLLDALIAALQARWQQLHAAAAAAAGAGTAAAAAPQAEAAGEQSPGALEPGIAADAAAEEGDGGEGGRAAKRPRCAADSCQAGGGAALPPWSLGPRGTPVASAQLPSLEAFWRDYMAPGTPLVISGEQQLRLSQILPFSFECVHVEDLLQLGLLCCTCRSGRPSAEAARRLPAPHQRAGVAHRHRFPHHRHRQPPLRHFPQARWRTGLRCCAGPTQPTWCRWLGPAPCQSRWVVPPAGCAPA